MASNFKFISWVSLIPVSSPLPSTAGRHKTSSTSAWLWLLKSEKWRVCLCVLLPFSTPSQDTSSISYNKTFQDKLTSVSIAAWGCPRFTDQMSKAFLFLRLLTGMLDVSQNASHEKVCLSIAYTNIQRGNKVLSPHHRPSCSLCPFSSHRGFVWYQLSQGNKAVFYFLSGYHCPYLKPENPC